MYYRVRIVAVKTSYESAIVILNVVVYDGSGVRTHAGTVRL